MNLNINLNKILIISGVLAFAFIIAFFSWWWAGEIEVTNGEIEAINNFTKSPISGIACENASRRPVASMLSSDEITRPLSGIGAADIVFEMPVTPDGVTRIMAIYQCENPDEIGSVRSAREDFIPLVASFGAVYAHWGGEHEALVKLNKHIVDNVDAMVYENIYFFRKKGIAQPHNGFTKMDDIVKAATDLKYNMSSSFAGYLHTDKTNPKNLVNIADSITIDYRYPFNVDWAYDKEKNVYKRSRAGTPEIDKNNGQQVEVKTVIVMETTFKRLSKDYISIPTTGSGSATIYQNGIKISGKWSKSKEQLDSKLFFYDTNGKEIEFTPGKMWVEVVTL